nr:MAG TPA: Protein of unknown function (DUF1642) [Caudoviricetes sp.]
MDKKELVEKIESLPSHTSITSFRPYVDKKIVLGLVRQLDKPQKVKIPQFVADVIEYVREDSSELEQAFQSAWWYESDEFTEWYKKKSNRDVFGRAWLDGYEVEEEKRYIIKLKGVPDGAKFLKYAKVTQEWYFGMKGFYSDGKIRHTRKQLEEAGFGWVFDCEGVEIEEVEE